MNNEPIIQEYYSMPGLADVYLEDSYVTGIQEGGSIVVFQLDIVLREGHPCYLPPKPNEQYCYRIGTLSFPEVINVKWLVRNFQRYTDAAGQVDFGNIDKMYRSDGKYHLMGDWGEVVIISANPIMHIEGCVS